MGGSGHHPCVTDPSGVSEVYTPPTRPSPASSFPRTSYPRHGSVPPTCQIRRSDSPLPGTQDLSEVPRGSLGPYRYGRSGDLPTSSLLVGHAVGETSCRSGRAARSEGVCGRSRSTVWACPQSPTIVTDKKRRTLVFDTGRSDDQARSGVTGPLSRG